jgi:hypothetical protein
MFALFKEIMILKLRKIKWAGNVARMGDIRNACKVLVRNLKGDISMYGCIKLISVTICRLVGNVNSALHRPSVSCDTALNCA